jgi:hypothetical protein
MLIFCEWEPPSSILKCHNLRVRPWTEKKSFNNEEIEEFLASAVLAYICEKSIKDNEYKNFNELQVFFAQLP